MKGTCVYCGKTFTPKSTGQFYRSIRLGLNVFCGRKCAGLNRRTHETPEEKKVYKQWYDLFIRASRTEDEKILFSLQALVLFHLDYRANPEKYREERQRRMADHIEYCRQPGYRKYKKEYDEQYHAKKKYGEYWEAAIILNKLENEIDNRQARKENKLFQKSSGKRKRSWQKLLKQNLRNLQPQI